MYYCTLFIILAIFYEVYDECWAKAPTLFLFFSMLMGLRGFVTFLSWIWLFRLQLLHILYSGRCCTKKKRERAEGTYMESTVD